MDELTQNQNAVALAAKALTQEKAQAYELVGMLKAFDFTQKLVTVTTLKTINEIKQSKQYKGLELLNKDGELVTVTSFKDFCTALGFSVEKIDADLLNLNTLGEAFLETSQRLGLGYREMRKLRQLPEAARAEIVDADYSEATDKEDLIEKIEDLTAKFAKEKTALESQLKTAKDNYDAQSKVLANKNARIDELDTKLAKKEQLIATQTPEDRGGLLREEAAKISYKAEAILRGQVYQAFEALQAHQTEHGIDHKQFMSGVLAEYQLILSELKEQFGLEDTPSGEILPEWARTEFHTHEVLDSNTAQLLDEAEV